MPGDIARVEVVEDDCVGSGGCQLNCPNTFAMNEAGHAYVIDPHGDTEYAIGDAASRCPGEAILLFRHDGSEITMLG